MKAVRIILDQLTQFGGLIFYGIVLGLLFLLSEWGIFFALLISLVACMGLAVLIRSFYFKARPKKLKHSNFLEKLDASSFPSIHSMRSVSLAFWLSIHFGSSLIAIYLVILAMLVMISRISLKKHDVSDVFFGMMFSLGINLLIWWLI